MSRKMTINQLTSLLSVYLDESDILIGIFYSSDQKKTVILHFKSGYSFEAAVIDSKKENL